LLLLLPPQVELRSRLEDNMHGKDSDIAALSEQVTRLNHALQVGDGSSWLAAAVHTSLGCFTCAA
jgi:predicted HD phosphohydrolase